MVSGQQPPWQLPPGQPPLWAMRFTHHIQLSSFVYRTAACRGVLAARRLRITVLGKYCFNVVQQECVATLLLLPRN